MSVRSLDERGASELLVKAPENELVMGVSHTGPVSNEALARRQRAVRRQVRSRPSGPVGLVCRDGINFSAGLRAILGCGRDVIIAPDDTPAVLSDIGDRVTAIVADFPTGLGHEVRVDEGGSEAALEEVRAEGSPRVHFFTSGSSGERKLVTKTAAQLVGEAMLLEQMWGPVVEKGLIAGTVSHQHLYGFLFRIVWPTITGRPIYGPTLEAHRVAEVAAREGIGVLVSCPAHLRRLPSLVKGASDFSELACIFSSGGPLDFDAALACRRSLGSAPVEVYGSTETGGIAWRQQTSPTRRRMRCPCSRSGASGGRCPTNVSTDK